MKYLKLFEAFIEGNSDKEEMLIYGLTTAVEVYPGLSVDKINAIDDSVFLRIKSDDRESKPDYEFLDDLLKCPYVDGLVTKSFNIGKFAEGCSWYQITLSVKHGITKINTDKPYGKIFNFINKNNIKSLEEFYEFCIKCGIYLIDVAFDKHLEIGSTKTHIKRCLLKIIRRNAKVGNNIKTYYDSKSRNVLVEMNGKFYIWIPYVTFESQFPYTDHFYDGIPFEYEGNEDLSKINNIESYVDRDNAIEFLSMISFINSVDTKLYNLFGIKR